MLVVCERVYRRMLLIAVYLSNLQASLQCKRFICCLAKVVIRLSLFYRYGESLIFVLSRFFSILFVKCKWYSFYVCFYDWLFGCSILAHGLRPMWGNIHNVSTVVIRQICITFIYELILFPFFLFNFWYIVRTQVQFFTNLYCLCVISWCITSVWASG